MPDEFDFLNAELSEEDKILLAEREKAIKKREAAWAGIKVPKNDKESDEAREAAAKQMAAAIKAGEEAARLAGKSLDVTQQQAIEAAKPTTISVWTVDRALERLFAPTWKQLKEKMREDTILQAKPGEAWTVFHLELEPTFECIFAYFHPNPSSPFPESCIRERFEVIVISGNVFRSDPE